MRSGEWSRRAVLGAGAALLASPALAIDPFTGAGGGNPVAQTRAGQVRGRSDDGVAVFKGV